MKTDFLNKIVLDISYPTDILPAKELYIADITGNDSIAAIIMTIEEKSPKFILPSVISLGCEFGDKDQASKTVDGLRGEFEKYGVKVFDGVLIDINMFWKVFIGKSINHTIEAYSFFSPCIACHLLMHISRIKLSQHFRSTNVISGEREIHGDKEKINQLPFVLDLYNELFNSFGVTHHTPARRLRNNTDILDIVNNYGVCAVQLDCLFSGTYYDLNNRIIIDKGKLSDYVQYYLVNKLNDFPENIRLKCSSISSKVG
jgi:hypothetical protein